MGEWVGSSERGLIPLDEAGREPSPQMGSIVGFFLAPSCAGIAIFVRSLRRPQRAGRRCGGPHRLTRLSLFARSTAQLSLRRSPGVDRIVMMRMKNTIQIEVGANLPLVCILSRRKSKSIDS